EPAQPAAAPAPAPAPKAPVAPVPIEEYFKIHRVGYAAFTHDEKQVAFVSDQGGRLDPWIAPVSGGEARQLTRVQGFVHNFEFSPTADVLVYEADVGGSELAHLYLTDASGKAPVDLCADYPPSARTQFIGFSEDGKTFLYLSSQRDASALDLREYDLRRKQSKILWQASGAMAFALASRDHKRFILVETLSDVNSNMYLLERSAKKPVLLTPHQGDVSFGPTAFSKDGRTLYFTSDEAGEFSALYAMDLKTKKSTPVLAADWDVEFGGFSRGFRYFYTLINEDGTAKVALADAKTKAPVALPTLGGPGGFYPINFSKSDRYLAATLLTDQAPPEMFVLDLAQNRPVRLTEVLPPTLRGQAMVAGESVRIPSFDGRNVPAFLYRPAGAGPHPAVIQVHGGPTAQSRRRFDAFVQYLVSKGYVVLVPNVRGSTGYGKSYTKLDNLDLGGGPLQDVVACKKWLAENASVDAERVVVLGGSYGGYMALAAAAFTPSEFAALVDYFGPSDLKTLVESFPPYWAAFASYIYAKFGDPKNPAHEKYQHDRSPIHFAERIVRPLLVVQGKNDVRVREDQSDRIVQALRARNVPVEYLVLPDEGHGFSKEESRLRVYRLTDRFLDRYLFGDTSVAVTAD
ncbi:MAG: S9 family peptidase, partial [Myxococcales bacterium]|nr:S9 family peptidase [Myxococcales bacterium]